MWPLHCSPLALSSPAVTVESASTLPMTTSFPHTSGESDSLIPGASTVTQSADFVSPTLRDYDSSAGSAPVSPSFSIVTSNAASAAEPGHTLVTLPSGTVEITSSPAISNVSTAAVPGETCDVDRNRGLVVFEVMSPLITRFSRSG